MREGVTVYKAVGETQTCYVRRDRAGLSLFFDHGPVQSRMLLADPYALALSYTRAMMAFLLFRREPDSVLQLGLGGGSLSRFLWHHFPRCQLEVVEHSPTVVDIAYRWFRLPQDERLQVHTADAAVFLALDTRTYDVVMVDAYGADAPAPALLEPRFFRRCKQALAPGGVLVVNLWLGPCFARTLQHIQTQFRAPVVQLPLEGKGNVVALAADRWPQRPAAELRKHAARLEQRYGLEFGRFLRQLSKDNALV